MKGTMPDETLGPPDLSPPPVADAGPVRPAPRAIARRAARAVVEWLKSVSLALLLFLVLRAFLVEAFKIPSGSMEGTLDRKSTRLNSSHSQQSRMPSSA